MSARVGTDGFSSRNEEISKRIDNITVSGTEDVSKRIDKTYISGINDVSKRIDKTYISGFNDVSKRIENISVSGIDDVVSKRVDQLTDNNHNNTTQNISKRIVQISDCTDIFIRSNSGPASDSTEMNKVVAAEKTESDYTEICKRIDAADCTGQSF